MVDAVVAVLCCAMLCCAVLCADGYFHRTAVGLPQEAPDEEGSERQP